MTSSGAIFDFAEIRKRLKELNVDPIFPVEKEPEKKPEPVDLDHCWYGGEYC